MVSISKQKAAFLLETIKFETSFFNTKMLENKRMTEASKFEQIYSKVIIIKKNNRA